MNYWCTENGCYAVHSTTNLENFVVFTFYGCVLHCFSRVRLCVTLWTVAHQGPLSMEFSRQEYWSGLLCSNPCLFESPALAGRFFTTRTTWEIVVKIGTVFFSKLQLKPSDCPEMLLVTPSVDHESLLIWNNCNNNLDSHQQMLKLLSENLVRKRMFG